MKMDISKSYENVLQQNSQNPKKDPKPPQYVYKSQTIV